VVGAILARVLHADLDVVLARKLRSFNHQELAVGALAENGAVYLDPRVRIWPEGVKEYLEAEKRFQGEEIARRRALVRSVRPAAPIRGRSVIVADDGIASGATLLAALDVVRGQHPRELIVAVPVCPTERVAAIRRRCDDLVCLLCPEDFSSIGQFYENFHPVSDQEVLELLRQFAPGSAIVMTGRG
jgi:predicted phosphoribosyltransferase